MNKLYRISTLAIALVFSLISNVIAAPFSDWERAAGINRISHVTQFNTDKVMGLFQVIRSELKPPVPTPLSPPVGWSAYYEAIKFPSGHYAITYPGALGKIVWITSYGEVFLFAGRKVYRYDEQSLPIGVKDIPAEQLPFVVEDELPQGYRFQALPDPGHTRGMKERHFQVMKDTAECAGIYDLHTKTWHKDLVAYLRLSANIGAGVRDVITEKTENGVYKNIPPCLRYVDNKWIAASDIIEVYVDRNSDSGGFKIIVRPWKKGVATEDKKPVKITADPKGFKHEWNAALHKIVGKMVATRPVQEVITPTKSVGIWISASRKLPGALDQKIYHGAPEWLRKWYTREWGERVDPVKRIDIAAPVNPQMPYHLEVYVGWYSNARDGVECATIFKIDAPNERKWLQNWAERLPDIIEAAKGLTTPCPDALTDSN
ncbi:MAG: hypothetical protein ABIC04_02205 [Nanoarchaeota archaeon]